MADKKDQIDQNYQKFINTLIKDLGLDSLPEKKRKEAVERISAIAQHRILQTILLCAKEEDLKELEGEISDASDPAEVYRALADKIEGLDAKIQDTLSELYLNLKEEISAAKKEAK